MASKAALELETSARNIRVGKIKANIKFVTRPTNFWWSSTTQTNLHGKMTTGNTLQFTNDHNNYDKLFPLDLLAPVERSMDWQDRSRHWHETTLEKFNKWKNGRKLRMDVNGKIQVQTSA